MFLVEGWCLCELKMNEDIRNDIQSDVDEFQSDHDLVLEYDREQHLEKMSEALKIEEKVMKDRIDFCKRLLNTDMSLEEISELTGLSRDEIEKIQN